MKKAQDLFSNSIIQEERFYSYQLNEVINSVTDFAPSRQTFLFSHLKKVWKGFWERQGKTNIVSEGKILLLDDNKDLLLIVQIILKGQGYETVQAACVDEAIQKIKVHRPALILMDVFIKDEDGRELCSQLKKNGETSAIKIIMMSGIESDNQSLYTIGADDFMQKPFDYDDLLQKVQRQMVSVEA